MSRPGSKASIALRARRASHALGKFGVSTARCIDSRRGILFCREIRAAETPQHREAAVTETKDREIRRALRALLSDIEGMYEGAELPAERGHHEEFFGPFSVGRVGDMELEGRISVSWPNLAISMQNARKALGEAGS